MSLWGRAETGGALRLVEGLAGRTSTSSAWSYGVSGARSASEGGDCGWRGRATCRWGGGERVASRASSGYEGTTSCVDGPVWAAVFVAEIGDVTRFASARHLCSWAGLTPRHRESDTTVHRGAITKMGFHPGALGRGRGMSAHR
jgi:Transposase IS116/IS110/IS902 family